MLETNEKRNFSRVAIECPANFTISGEDAIAGAVVKDLSGGGVLMWIEREVSANTVLSIEVAPVNNITPPMKAEVKVVRCTPVEGADGYFAVACAMERVIA